MEVFVNYLLHVGDDDDAQELVDRHPLPTAVVDLDFYNYRNFHLYLDHNYYFGSVDSRRLHFLLRSPDYNRFVLDLVHIRLIDYSFAASNRWNPRPDKPVLDHTSRLPNDELAL